MNNFIGVLKKLSKMLNDWGIKATDWMVVSQYSFILDGFEVPAKEGHLNIIIKKSAVPWRVNEDVLWIDTYVPKDSHLQKAYIKFIGDTGFGVDFVPLPDSFFDELEKMNFSKWHESKLFKYCTLEGGLYRYRKFMDLDVLDRKQSYMKIYTWLQKNEPLIRKQNAEIADSMNHLMRDYGKRYNISKEKNTLTDQPVSNDKMLKGTPVVGGIIEGRAHVVVDYDDIGRFNQGDIIVVDLLETKLTPLYKKLGGIISSQGGSLSHAAVVAREWRIPCIIGVFNATKLIKNKSMIKLDGSNGTVSILN